MNGSLNPFPTPNDAAVSSLGRVITSSCGVGAWLARVALCARQPFSYFAHVLHGFEHRLARSVVSKFVHVPTFSRRRYRCHGANSGALRHV